MRKPIVAGSFYPSSNAELKEQINNFLKKSEIKKTNKIYGLVAPHAGYPYSGPCAAYAYKLIASAGKFDTFVILGANHTGYIESDFALSAEDFETPLGVAKNDKQFYDFLLKNGKDISAGDTARDKIAHQREHSIEVQLPFLQTIFQDKFKIVPVICQVKDSKDYTGLANLIVNAAKKLKRKICVIASGDFTHYGISYGFAPFSTNVKENLYALDKGAIDLISKLKAKEFLEYAKKTTICGAGVIAAAIEVCKATGSKKAALLRYYTSGDITGDYSSAVGYGSIVFE